MVKFVTSHILLIAGAYEFLTFCFVESDLVFDSLMHLDLALKSAGMGIFSFDIRQNRPFLDKQSLDILGITSEKQEYDLNDLLEIAHPDDRKELVSLFFMSVKKVKDFEAEYRIIWKDGSLHYIITRAKIIKDEDANPLRFNGLIWDITEQKFLEMNLHENLRKMNSIINNLNGVVFRFRLDDNLTMEFISRGVMEITGYPFREFQMNKTRSFHSLIAEEDRARVITEIKEATRQDRRYSIEYRITSADGSTRSLAERGHGVPVVEGAMAVEGIITEITDRKNIESKLNRSLKQLKQLNQYLHTVRENERVAISRELHDDLGQALTAVKIDLVSLKKIIPGNEEARIKIDNIALLVTNTIKSVLNITAQLRPQIIDDLGLEAAIEWYMSDFSARTGIKVRLSLEPVPELPSGKSLVIFRIMQESLTNIARHSKATNAGIKLSMADNSVVLKVVDNGIGISGPDFRSKKSFGLISMRERAKSFGGELKISAPVKGGTSVTLILPVSDKQGHENLNL